MFSRIRLCFPVASGGWASVYYMYAVPARGEAFSFFFKDSGRRCAQVCPRYAQRYACGALSQTIARARAVMKHALLLFHVSRETHSGSGRIIHTCVRVRVAPPVCVCWPKKLFKRENNTILLVKVDD